MTILYSVVNYMKKLNAKNCEIAKVTFCAAVVVSLLIMPFLPVRDEGEIYDNTLRLHVLANSDSTDDQILKLKVRDAIVQKADILANDCYDVESAKEIYLNNLDVLKETAEQIISENGYDYGVTVTLGEE